MLWHTKSTVRRSGMEPAACRTLVVLACIALASCGGGPGTVHPDLVVEDPSVSDDRPAAGASFTFSATVRNAGDGGAAATTLRVFRSDDETITPAEDEKVGAATVEALAASARRVASVAVTAPSSPGTSYYGACADPVAGESGTANNCSAAVRVIVQAHDTEPASPQPDLVVEAPAVSDDRPAAGASFTFSATVRNAGSGDAAATTLRVYRSDDETITPAEDEKVGDASVEALAASARRAVSLTMTVTAPSSPGTSYYGACADPVARESDTANNCSATVRVIAQVQVQKPAPVPAPEPDPPDMVVSRIWASNSSPAIGGYFRLWAQVRNRVGAPTYTTLRFYLSTDATITRSDTQFATYWTSVGHNAWVNVKAPSKKGVYYYGACPDAATREPLPGNPCSAAVRVEVSHFRPNLVVGAWAVSDARPVGKSLSVGASVRNVGSPSEATTLRLRLLPDRTSKPSAGTQVGEVDVPELVYSVINWPPFVPNVEFQAPATAGTYYYVMCVDAVREETDTANNCSGVTKIEFH